MFKFLQHCKIEFFCLNSPISPTGTVIKTKNSTSPPISARTMGDLMGPPYRCPFKMILDARRSTAPEKLIKLSGRQSLRPPLAGPCFCVGCTRWSLVTLRDIRTSAVSQLFHHFEMISLINYESVSISSPYIFCAVIAVTKGRISDLRRLYYMFLKEYSYSIT